MRQVNLKTFSMATSDWAHKSSGFYKVLEYRKSMLCVTGPLIRSGEVLEPVSQSLLDLISKFVIFSLSNGCQIPFIFSQKHYICIKNQEISL